MAVRLQSPPIRKALPDNGVIVTVLLIRFGPPPRRRSRALAVNVAGLMDFEKVTSTEATGILRGFGLTACRLTTTGEPVPLAQLTVTALVALFPAASRIWEAS